ncbi:hypothetical protein [Pseudodesulfovibrio karagichevae]|uniref:Uncharacterized protein n=1 Tax=Pseudodesulfovibrio karagichevae TaxID=3239305 RepID=A0ABV4JZZ0_9BACT
MNKVTPIILAFTMTLMAGSLACAMDDEDMDPNYIAMRQDVLAMDNSMRLIEQAVNSVQSPADCQEALKSLNSHIADMRSRMSKVDTYAELSGNMTMSASLHRLDKAMTATMQGVGLCLRDSGQALPKVREGVGRMRVALDEIRAGV